MSLDWLTAQQDQPRPSLAGGASGYLSPPRSDLDPALFGTGNVLHHNVAGIVLRPLTSFLAHQGFRGMGHWLRAWLAGSAVTYQWGADRGNGDLDVLLGIDRVPFDLDNPDYDEFGDDQLAGEINERLKAGLWPRTADTKINGRVFEVTYFYNPGTSTDIRKISPYAAYDLITSRWIVPPPELPRRPASQFPRSWFEAAQEDTEATAELLSQYNFNTEQQRIHPPGSRAYINAGAALNLVTAAAQARLTDIHHGRTLAFQGGGEGYGDWHNFRWQRAKASGAVKALSGLVGVRERAEEDAEGELYGGPVRGADELVRRAMLYRRHG